MPDAATGQGDASSQGAGRQLVAQKIEPGAQSRIALGIGVEDGVDRP